MCQWGTDELCLVPMPAELSYTGEFRWAIRGVDACIAPLVNALNAAGIYTANCCCGHGKGLGRIDLHDGRILWVDTRKHIRYIPIGKRLVIRYSWQGRRPIGLRLYRRATLDALAQKYTRQPPPAGEG